MKLYMSGNSPYARRARIAVREGGLRERVEEISVSAFDELLQVGPGAKIPVLITDSGIALCESIIVTRYLNDQSGGDLLPRKTDQLETCLALESTACVLMDSLFVRSMECNYREEAMRSVSVLAREKARSLRCYDALETQVTVAGSPVTLAVIAVVSALGYADWRAPEDDWRKGRPALASFHDRYMERAAFRETAPVY